MTNASKKVCFVVMGFGKKTDYETGRTLDLDATYEAIIRPAVEDSGLRCIRSDEVLHSGTIDIQMFEMLLRSDLVIADISTGNVNALYELGVRHGLAPRATIIMKESEGRLHFDLNHINTFEYEHLGVDIGAREAVRAKRALADLISAVMESGAPDSPVYTFLPKLKRPQLSDEEYQELLDETEEAQLRLSKHLEDGDVAIKESRFSDAVAAFQLASQMKPEDPYILQRLVLSTYKSLEPSPFAALLEAHKLIQALDPDRSNDPETTGLAGAIHKRLWKQVEDVSQLDAAIRFYRRGFEVRRDYYNGENLAACFDMRAGTLENDDEITFYRISARKVRESLIEILEKIVESPSFRERSDRHWVYATLANCHFSIGEEKRGAEYEREFLELNPAEWEIDTYNQGKSEVGASQESKSTRFQP